MTGFAGSSHDDDEEDFDWKKIAAEERASAHRLAARVALLEKAIDHFTDVHDDYCAAIGFECAPVGYADAYMALYRIAAGVPSVSAANDDKRVENLMAHALRNISLNVCDESIPRASIRNIAENTLAEHGHKGVPDERALASIDPQRTSEAESDEPAQLVSDPAQWRAERNLPNAVEGGQIRWSVDRSERIKVFGCYGSGSGGAMWSVSAPNLLSAPHPIGMFEQDIETKYPFIAAGPLPRPNNAKPKLVCGAFEPSDDMVPVTCTLAVNHDGKCSWARWSDEQPRPGQAPEPAKACAACGCRSLGRCPTITCESEGKCLRYQNPTFARLQEALNTLRDLAERDGSVAQQTVYEWVAWPFRGVDAPRPSLSRPDKAPPEGFAERLLAIWTEAQGVALGPDFHIWDGATKDLLIDMGLEWNAEEDCYELDAGVAKSRRDAAKRTPRSETATPTTTWRADMDRIAEAVGCSKGTNYGDILGHIDEIVRAARETIKDARSAHLCSDSIDDLEDALADVVPTGGGE